MLAPHFEMEQWIPKPRWTCLSRIANSQRLWTLFANNGSSYNTSRAPILWYCRSSCSLWHWHPVRVLVCFQLLQFTSSSLLMAWEKQKEDPSAWTQVIHLREPNKGPGSQFLLAQHWLLALSGSEPAGRRTFHLSVTLTFKLISKNLCKHKEAVYKVGTASTFNISNNTEDFLKKKLEK